MTKTPVVLLIFNRADLTSRVFDVIAQVRPQKLFVVADGPRANRWEEREQCDLARAATERVTWACDVVRDYSDVNLGCDRRVPLGITRAFNQVDDAIILEDDCVPHPSFFRFCEELLERYRDDERVMHVAGSTYRPHPVATPHSYFFSQFNGCWGWATWRRAWRYFDPSVNLWTGLRNTSWLADLVEYRAAVEYWSREFDEAHTRGSERPWDHQWTFACWANSGLSIVPRVNLVTNAGFGAAATHMRGEDDPIANLPAHEMPFPLSHPPSVVQFRDFDRAHIRDLVLPRLRRPSPARVLASRVTPQFAKTGLKRFVHALRASAAAQPS